MFSDMNIKIGQVYDFIDDLAPFSIQESWDNSGLQVGDLSENVNKILVCLDVTPNAVDFAVENKVNLIISHHPFFFRPLKKIDFSNDLLKKIVINNISIISNHTPIDLMPTGTSRVLADKLGLKVLTTLFHFEKSIFCKLNVFVPVGYEHKILDSIFKKGVGEFLNYKNCAFETIGEGLFSEKESAKPFVKNNGFFKEGKLELIVRKDKISETIRTLKNIHPYQEVAYDVFEEFINPLNLGYGCVCEYSKQKKLSVVLNEIKNFLGIEFVKFKGDLNSKIKRVALCGGSGASFISSAINANADVYITGDIKYHDALENYQKICLVDVGHRASELPVVDFFYEELSEKFYGVELFKLLENNDFFQQI